MLISSVVKSIPIRYPRPDCTDKNCGKLFALNV